MGRLEKSQKAYAKVEATTKDEAAETVANKYAKDEAVGQDEAADNVGNLRKT